jgi:uncharacterized phage-like protein YoqJ
MSEHTASIWPKVMVTGHRPQHLHPEQQDYAQQELGRLAVKLRDDNGTRVAISGMALGADQWWAHYALLAELELHAYLPFPQQPAKWHHEQQRTWRALVGQAAVKHFTAEHYSVQALHQRNDQMLDAADAVIAVWDPRITTGGTYSCVQKASRLGLPVIHVDLQDFQTSLRRSAR